jgi:methylated-DNA-[protein]-cysteine S-methyltransferase
MAIQPSRTDMNSFDPATTLAFDTFSTPVGDFSVAVDPAGALVATAFGGEKALRGRLRPCRLLRNTTVGVEARRQIADYFAGARQTFSLQFAPLGTDFQRRVWAALLAIPFGETRSYREIAKQIGNPAASRAVGRANATNPICLLVPCHRVIGSDGSLTGFAFGETIKRQLLEHERSTAMRAA